jgi:hypothetical protein
MPHSYQGCLLTLFYLGMLLLVVCLSGSLWLLFRVF